MMEGFKVRGLSGKIYLISHSKNVVYKDLKSLKRSNAFEGDLNYFKR